MAYKRNALLASTAAFALLTTMGTVLADGGGGGGGGFSLPSESAPRYDPTKDYQAGIAALQANNFEEADRLFTRVLRETPRDVPTLLLSGAAKTGKNDLRGALGAYERALRANRNHIMARREYAVTLVKLGDRDKATAELNTLKERATTCAETCRDAAELKTAITAVETALAPSGSTSLEIAPSMDFAPAGTADQAYLDAIGLINEARYVDALDSLEAARFALGPHPDVLTYLGFTYRKMGDYAMAETYYQQALAIAPDHLGATEYYGELKVERGDLAGARQMLARLDALCTFGCPQAEELRRWIEAR
jgi:tetratricopeptide (TPR) repeat protein